MSYSEWSKVLKQLESKPAKMLKYKKHNAPKTRTCGRGKKRCSRCLRIRAHIDKYGIDMCRQCFRDTATKLGFKKYN